MSYGYDAASRRTSITYPGGSNQATYTYDAANRLTAVTGWHSNSIQYGYDDAGRMTSATLPSSTGIVTSYSYDDADRLTGISHVKDGSTTVASVAYTLDDVGNRTQRVDQQGTHTYAYDDLYRLTSVTYPGPSTTTYAFDAFGNRTSMTTSAGTTAYTFDDADRITGVQPPSPAAAIDYTWDDNGNLVERGSDTFEWDFEDRMVEATVNSVTSTFAYRGDGLRDSRTVGMTTTTFTWDINAGLPVVLDDGNQYLYGAGLSAMKQGGNWFYYLADGLGSTMAVVDSTGMVANGYTYDVYGEPTVTGSLANEFDFAGQQTDGSTGLQYLRARYYDPQTGTFLGRDPLNGLPRWRGNPTAYAAGSPVNVADPSGLIPDGNGAALDSGCQVTSSWCWNAWGEGTGAWWEATFNLDENMLYLRKCALVNEKRVCGDPFSYEDFNRSDNSEEVDAASQLFLDGLAVALGLRAPVTFSDHGPAGSQGWARHLVEGGLSRSVAKWQIMLDARRQLAAGALREGVPRNVGIMIQGRWVTYTAYLRNGVINIGTVVLGVRNR